MLKLLQKDFYPISYSVRVAITENCANFLTFSRITLIPRSSEEFNSITRSRNN